MGLLLSSSNNRDKGTVHKGRCGEGRRETNGGSDICKLTAVYSTAPA